jgi:hypothetical protein
MDRWVAGIIGGFAVLIGVYVLFITAAMQDPPAIEPSYEAARR